MFGEDDEDGDFLSPTGGSKLASLFGLDEEARQGNESFRYTAPKQPRKGSNAASAPQKPAPAPGAPVVLFATAVRTFRYINGQYVNQGKLGAAVLGNHATKEYKLLLYLSQQKQVTTAKLHQGFAFTVQPNNYCTFYDDQRQNWSLMFESEKAASDFCKELCLAKVNSTSSLDAVVVQDLCLGEGQAVEDGDSLEVVYTGWLLQNNAIGQMFDSNQNKDKLLRLKVGAGKVIKGWEEGMLGMKKAGRRFIIIPPKLAYGSKGVPNRVPSNSILVFEVELRRVKFAKDIGSDQASRSSAAPSPAPSPAPTVENLAPEPQGLPTSSVPGMPGEPPLRVKSNSISEQLENPDATKAKLISRMAKMGQPMLPFLTGVASQPESSDSEIEDTSGSRGKDRLMAPSPVHISTASSPAAYVHHHPHPSPPSALLPVMTTVAPQHGLPSSSHSIQPHSYTQTSVAQLQPVGQLHPAQTVPYIGASDVTTFLMTEARQHNTEIRLSVGKVADKVDQLASKIDELQRQAGVSTGMSSMSMETSMIMHNIQRIVQENESLKKDVCEKNFRIEEQNHKIVELINQNQRYMEQSHLMLEKRNDSLKSTSEQSQAKLLQAEQDKVRLTEDLASCTARLSQLQLEATAHQQKAFDLQTKLSSALQDSESRSQSMSALETQLEEVKKASESAQSQYRLEKQRRKEMELRVNNMEEEVQDLKTDKERLERALVEKKKKWQAESQRRDEEVEEVRKSSQQELDNLRVQLCKARTSSDGAASAQLSHLQAELEEEYSRKCEQMLASTQTQHNREMAGLAEQNDALQDKLTQLEQKLTALKQSRDPGGQNNGQIDELQALQQKYTALEQQEEDVKKKLECRVTELEMKLAEQEDAGNTAAEVKRVMNGVFHSLRGEFDVTESYSGQAVLAVIVATIKNVTLQLLSGSDRASLKPSKNTEEEEGCHEKHKETDHQNVNGAVEDDEEHETEAGPRHVTEIQVGQEGEAEEQVEAVTESKAPSQAEAVTESKAPSQVEAVTESKAPSQAEAVTESKAPSQAEAVTESKAPSQAEAVTESKAPSQAEAGTESKAPSQVEAVTESKAPSQAEALAATDPQLVPATDLKLQTAEVEQKQTESSLPETSRDEKDRDESVEPETQPVETGSETGSCSKAAATGEAAEEKENEGDHVEETRAASLKDFGPPTKPPPSPDHLHHSPEQDSSLTGAICEENGDEAFFQVTYPANPPTGPSEEEEEDEMSLKGRPPPTPLFGEEDDDDLDWMS